MADRPGGGPTHSKPNPCFLLVALFSAAFVVTILALVAAMLGDPAAPVNRWLDQHGGTLIAAEVAAILATGLLALAIDRRQTIRRLQNRLPKEDKTP